MKRLSSKITVLVSYSVHDNIWEIWLFIREFTITAMLKVVLCKSLAGLVELKMLASRK